MPYTVFVYGTLLRTMSRASEMKKSKFKGPGFIRAELYDLGAYPGVQSGESEVVVEIYEVGSSTLARLDRIEGYNVSSPTTSLFVRRAVEATSFADGSLVSGFAYFLDDAGEEGTLIDHGDYRRHIQERSNVQNWVVAYGSNIGRPRLAARVGEVSEFKKGFLEGFQLVFNKKASGKNTVYANIKYVGTGSCPAIAWKLTAAQTEVLDSFEGVPSHYVRISIPFVTQREILLSQVYIAHPSKLLNGLTPETTYVEYIRNGYREHGLGEEYLDDAITKITITL